MIARIAPAHLAGTVPAIASKSVAHRLIIAAALANGVTDVTCNTSCADIEATIRCLEALGAKVERAEQGLRVHPIPKSQEHGILRALAGATLDCGESGSTLRFMLPVACALGADATFTGAGRLGERPLSPLAEELIAAGCDLQGLGSLPLTTKGRLRAGTFKLPGNVSSQYISGLLLALPILGQPSVIEVTGTIESKPYITLTLQALETFGVSVRVETGAALDGQPRTRYLLDGSPYRTPGSVSVEGDWSNAAFGYAPVRWTQNASPSAASRFPRPKGTAMSWLPSRALERASAGRRALRRCNLAPSMVSRSARAMCRIWYPSFRP